MRKPAHGHDPALSPPGLRPLRGLARRLDWLGRFEDTTGVSPVGPLRRGQGVVQDLRSGHTLRGADGFALLCRQIPAYWPLLPALRLPPVRRAVAREFGGCTDNHCGIT